MSLHQIKGIDIVTQATPIGGGGDANSQVVFSVSFASPIVPISFPFADEVTWFTGMQVQNLDAAAGALLVVVYDPTGIDGGPSDVFPIELAPAGTPGAAQSIVLGPPFLGSYNLGVGFGIRYQAPVATASAAGLATGYYFPAG